MPLKLQNSSGERGAHEICQGQGSHKGSHCLGEVTTTKPVCEVDEHAWEKARFCSSQEKSDDIKLTGSVHESHQDRDDAPRDHDAGDPKARAPALDDKSSGDFQQHVADKEDSCTQPKDAVTETQIMRHFQSSVGDVDPVEKSDEIEEPQEGKQSNRDSTSGFPLKAERSGQAHFPS